MYDIDGKKIPLPNFNIENFSWKDCPNYSGKYIGDVCMCKQCCLERRKKERWGELHNESYFNEIGIRKEHYDATIKSFVGECDTVKKWNFEKVLMITGQKSGNGKTHLAVGLMKRFLYLNPFKNSIMMNFNELCMEMNSFDSGARTEYYLLSKSTLIDLLVLDDIGSENNYCKKIESEFYHIMNSRWEHKRPTIITMNLSSDLFFRRYGQRIYDRCKGLIQEVKGESRR